MLIFINDPQRSCHAAFTMEVGSQVDVDSGMNYLLESHCNFGENWGKVYIERDTGFLEACDQFYQKG